MDENYDTIVIGAGNSGLVAGLTLQKNGKKVLILEAGRVPGGMASSFCRGRFEFDVSLHELSNYGNENNPGEVYQLFERLGILSLVPMESLNETFTVTSLDHNETYSFPTGQSNFIYQMESYVHGSTKSMQEFFSLTEEIIGALHFIRESNGKPDLNTLKEKYPRFLSIAPYSLEHVLKSLKMPKKAIQILSSYWMLLGVPSKDISFIHYAPLLYSYIIQKPVIPTSKSHSISLALVEEFENCGGTIKYLNPVTKILTTNNGVVGVITANEKTYHTHHIIADISPNMVYGNLMDKASLPVNAVKLVNSRVLGARGICVYLGLNKTMEELGITHHLYYVYHDLDSNKEYKKMNKTINGNMSAFVMNNNTSDNHGTCNVTLTGLIFGDSFDRVVTKENYFDLKEALADTLIFNFEQATKSKIMDAIEEIEIATPVTFARYTNHPDGAIYGYLASGEDNLLSRLLDEDKEVFIKGLRFTGGFASMSSGYSSTYLNGEYVALKTLKDGDFNE